VRGEGDEGRGGVRCWGWRLGGMGLGWDGLGLAAVVVV